jgi:outer membrane protein
VQLFLKGMSHFLYGFLMLVGVALPVHGQSFDGALSAAYNNSNILAQQQATLRAADEGVAQALSALRPVLEYTATINRQADSTFFSDALTRTFDLAARITLLDFGRNRANIQIQKESVLAARAALGQAEQNIIFSAASAYVTLLRQSETVNLRKSNLKLVERELEAAKDRFAVGEVTRTDIAITEARLAAARAALALARGDVANARQAYRVAVGLEAGELALLPDLPVLPVTLNMAQKIAQERHPNIIQAQRQTAISELSVKVARASFLPTISGRVQVTRGDQRTDTDSGGVTLTQQLYTGGRRSSVVRQTLSQLDVAQASEKEVALRQAEAVSNAWTAIEVAKAQIDAGRLQVKAARIAFEGLREEARVGARTTLEVLNAEQEWLDARVSLLEVEGRHYLSAYQVLESVGMLSAQNLGLDVTVYNPDIYSRSVEKAPSHFPKGGKLDSIRQKIGK